MPRGRAISSPRASLLFLREGQHSRCDRLILQHAPENQWPNRSEDDSSTVGAHVKCVPRNRVPSIPMQFERERYRRDFGRLTVVIQTLEVVRIGGPTREDNPVIFFASAGHDAETCGPGMRRQLAPFDLV